VPKETIFVVNELSLVELGKSRAFGKDCAVLSRIYRSIHDKKTLIWINEMFPLDDRWSL
jgi:chorismate-pyruvate lyase